ncbi:MAG: hypothetical protein AAGF83_03665 [Cyanobacteria bacterium P01_G01_bin.67]
MNEVVATNFTKRGWKEDPMFPPGFFYPQKDGLPHLHLTSVIDPKSGKHVMSYLHYKDKNNQVHIIFNDGKWNNDIVNTIPEQNLRDEVNFAKEYK